MPKAARAPEASMPAKKRRQDAELPPSKDTKDAKKRARPSSSGEEQKAPPKKKGQKTSVVTVEPTVSEPAKTKVAAAATNRKKPESSTAVAAAASPEAGSGKLDREQLTRAVHALLTHVERENAQGLLDGEAPINVLFSTKQVPKAVGKATASKPVPLPLPHPFVSLETADICLFTTDPQREFKDKLAEQGLRAKVIGVSKLKKKYHPYEAKRELCAAYDIFLADARILPMLPPLLGA
jgi:hypothetical protein